MFPSPRGRHDELDYSKQCNPEEPTTGYVLCMIDEAMCAYVHLVGSSWTRSTGCGLNTCNSNYWKQEALVDFCPFHVYV
jgi:hypothetical protein